LENVLMGSIGGKARQQALWFVQLEKERILHNYHLGCASKDHALGGLSTLYHIASRIEDVDCMKNLMVTISDIRNSRLPGLRFPGSPQLVGL